MRLMEDAGLHPGDQVAIDSSGSFPGFAIAAILAAESLGAKSTVIVSVGSSTWGANRPDFSLPDILASLAARGLLPHGADAVSPGGADDAGTDMDPAFLAVIIDRAAARGSHILGTKYLPADIAQRLAFFAAEGTLAAPSAAPSAAPPPPTVRTPALLVSIGGNLPSTGLGDVLAGRSGLIRASDFPRLSPSGGRKVPGIGLVQSFLAEGRPVIRLIDVKDIAARTGLPWDPYPWPTDPGLPPRSGPATRLIAIATIILAFLATWAVRRRQKRRA
jgi:poly-gamma-glutamate system protein